MKRPLAVVGFTLLPALFILCTFENLTLTLLSAIVLYLLFTLSAVVPKFKSGYFVPTAMFCAFLACVMFYFAQSDYDKLSSLAESDADIVCCVAQEPDFDADYGRYYCKAEVVTVDGEKYRGNIRLSFNGTYDNIDADSLKIGNTLSFRGHLYKVGGESKEIADYFKSENIYVGAYLIENLEVASPKVRPLEYYGNEIRKAISRNFRESFTSDTAGFLTALLTGDKTYVSDSVYDSFKNSGVAHLMAVSGMHLAVLVMFLNLFINKLRKNHKKLHFIIMVSFIFLIMFVASFSASVVRAGVMLTVLFAGELSDKRADSLNSLGFACICILLVNPFSALSAGFLLSVLSTLAIIIGAVPFCRRHRYFICDRLGLSGRVPFYIGGAVMLSLAISLCVMTFTMPVMALYFGRISLISPVANLLFLPVTTVIIVLAFVSAVFGALGYIPQILVFVTENISAYCLRVADLLGGTDRFVLKTDTPLKIALCILFPFAMYLAVKTASYIYNKIKHKRKPL